MVKNHPLPLLDAKREYAYGAESKIGTDKGWNVISMKKDWKRVFAFERE